MFFRKIFRRKALSKEDFKQLLTLEKKLGYHFHDLNLLKRALSHKSYSNESCLDNEDHNERLEFLGDAVLDLVVSHLIFKHFPDEREGQMSKIRASLVNERALAEQARTLGLGGYLFLGKGEDQSDGREKNSLLSDAFEALLGALYLDADFKTTFSVVEKMFLEQILRASYEDISHDYKTKLQEEIQNRFRVGPEYRLMAERGPDHEKIFEVHLFVNDKFFGKGTGRSKKQAEQNAAKVALEKFS